MRTRTSVSLAACAAVTLACVLGAQNLGPSSDPVVDYFNAGSKSPTDVFSVGPDGQPAQPPAADFFASGGRPRDCLEGLKQALRAGVQYGVIQDATRKRFYQYQTLARLQGFIWLTGPGGVQPVVGGFQIDANGIPRPAAGQMGPAGGIAGDDQLPTAPRVLCLTHYVCGWYVGCIGFRGKRTADQIKPALTSTDPCTQCNLTRDAAIDACRARAALLTSPQYNDCLVNANQEHQRCVARCRGATRVLDPNPQPSASCSSCMTIGSGYRPAPGTDPRLAWTAGFTKGTSECLKQGATNPVSLCLLAGAILAARFQSATAMAGIVVGGRALALKAVMDDAQRDLAASADPYQTGMFYGQRFCTWLTAGATFVTPAPKPRAVDPVAESCPGEVKPGESDFPVVQDGVPADPSTANTWLKTINPSGCNANCPFTPANVENALAGKGVMPAPPLNSMSSTGKMMPTQYAKEMLQDLYGRPFGSYQPAQQVAGIVQRGGWGARGILHASRPDGPGHFLNIVNYKGAVMLLDGQLGRTVSWADLGKFGFTSFSLMRTN